MKLVMVTWLDTFTELGWANAELSPVSITSVGVIIQENKNKIVLAGMIGAEGDYNCRQAIPRGCIKKITELRVR